MADDQINRVRQDIDALDEQLLALVNQRARLAQRIGELKKGADDAPVYRPEREAASCRRPTPGRCPIRRSVRSGAS